MTPLNQAHERDVVLGRTKPAQAVAPRDFKQPRRFGAARLRALHLLLKNALPALEKKLAETAGVRVGLALAGLGEVDADTIFAGAAEPLCVLRFRCQKVPAWLVWDSAAAVGVVEAILGSRAGAAAGRRLTATESKLASQFLAEITRATATTLGLTAADFALVQIATELGSWREAAADAEAHRLEIRLDVQRGEQVSALRLYLPGVDAGDGGAELPLPGKLPDHLQHVEIELTARLHGCEISLDQLLALEEGDVLPLDARLGDPTTLSVEGLDLAQARLGSHRGRLAVRIERLHVQPESLA